MEMLDDRLSGSLAEAGRARLSERLSMTVQLLRATEAHLAAGQLEAAIAAIVEALATGRPLLVCGNGGSAADAQHITGELVGRFLAERRALKAICLTCNSSVLTAWSNDYSFETVFARQVEAYGEAGAVLLGLTTSGSSPNILRAFEAARVMGMTTVALTGEGGGKLAALADILIDVPSRETPRIQEAHLCLYHHLCAEIEALLLGPS